MIDRSNDKTTERQIKDEILKNESILLSSIQKACDSGLFDYKDYKWIRKLLLNIDFKVCNIIAAAKLEKISTDELAR